MKNLFKVAIICALMFFSEAKAQENLTLSLDEAKNYALEHNRTLQKAGISIKESDEVLWQAIANGLPQVSATVDYSNYLGFSMAFGGQSIAFNPTSNAQLTVSQLIFSGQYWVGIEMAKLAKNFAEKNIIKTELDVKESVSLSYYTILMTEQTKNVLNENIKNIKDIHKRTSDLAKVGLIEETDAEQLYIQVRSLEAALSSLDRNIELAYNMLRIQLGVSYDTKITLTGNFDEYVEQPKKVYADYTFEENINYQLLKSQEELQLKQIKLNKAAYLPTVAAFYNYTYKLKKPAFDMSPANMVGLQANIPIFSSFQRASKVKQSQIQLRSIQKDLEQVEEQLEIQEKQLKFNLETALEQYRIQQDNVVVAKKVFESNKQKHEQGLLSALNLTTANSNYLQAESSLISAKNELLKAQTELMKLLGTL